MTKKIYISILLALLLVGCGGGGTNTSPVVINDNSSDSAIINDSPSDSQPTGIEKIYLDAINAARAEDQVCGTTAMSKTTALTWNDKLALASEDHARDISENDYRQEDKNDPTILMTNVDDGTIYEVTSINRHGGEHTTFHVGSGTSTDVALQTFPEYSKSTFVERIKHREYTAFQTAGENITSGTNRDNAEKAVQAWLDSEGHCKSLMNPLFKEVGMAHIQKEGSYYTHYWVQVFGG